MPQQNDFRAVVFDFDGTLGDSYLAITASVNHVRSLHGQAPLSEPEVRRHVGRGPVHLLQHTVGSASINDDLLQYREHYPTVMYAGTRLFPGVAAALGALRQGGLRLGVCSNKPREFTVRLLAYLQIAPLFEVVLGPEDVPHPKPAPDMLLTARDRLAVRPAELLYVGDMVVDIQTARGAGVTVWVVPTGSDDRATLEQSQPDRVLDRLADLPPLLGDAAP